VLATAGYAGLALASVLLVAGAAVALAVIARDRAERMRASDPAPGIRSH
jgi:hypothetical protein